MVVDSEVERIPKKGRIPSGTESTQGSAISQRQVPEIPITSEPELELSVSSSNRNKSNSKGSNRQINEQLQAVLHSLQKKDWEILPHIHQGVISSWNILKKILKEQEIVKYYNGWNPLSSKPQIERIKEWHNKKREASKEQAPLASTSKQQSSHPPQQGKKNKRKNRRKPYSPS
ncbi:hypothetical protein O181_028781 [Austropuccinia psidii MF-1]|uniref:Uncharacterized protein n=1 Tax=Austropuccinia psidii MF-1 TaxID=1389203 RepID=A0A9Q3CV83_9BASI|nr:hypothetical protein [Austropuccinia psidii MF-1]